MNRSVIDKSSLLPPSLSIRHARQNVNSLCIFNELAISLDLTRADWAVILGSMIEHVHHRCTEITLAGPFWRLPEACKSQWLALLDSALPGARLGRWSFLLPDPNLIVEAHAARSPRGLHLQRRDAAGEWHTGFLPGDPLALIDNLRSERGQPFSDTVPFPFRSGAVGWFGHGTGRFIEDLSETVPDRDGLPDLRLLFGDVVLAHRPDDGSTWLNCTGRGPSAAIAEQRSEELTEHWRDLVTSFCPPVLPELPTGSSQAKWTADLDGQAYAEAVASIQQDIHAGRVFEVNMTQTLQADLMADPWTLYRILRETNPAPFAAYIRTPDATIVSSSPERYLKLDASRRVESRPIKGTRPRSDDRAVDNRLHDELAGSLKDMAENIMIVDLVRSDIGRVCNIGSVRVPELCAVEGYATVWQMVSTIEGQLGAGKTAMDLIRACHPPGSMTGAPKIEALKVIDELETSRRSVYAGGIGYLDDGGGMDLHVVIRTVVVQDGVCRFGVGGAVTADSNPQDEYEETMDKARALVRAIGMANAMTKRPPEP